MNLKKLGKKSKEKHGLTGKMAGDGQHAPGAGQATVLLSARGIVKRYGGVTAVGGVSLDMRPGEVLGLIGPNGAGKTTLFDILAGDQPATVGEVIYDGRSITGLGAHRRLALGLGRTFQIPRPFPTMSLVENVMLAEPHQSGERLWPNWLTPWRVAREERATHDKAMDLLSFMTLQHLAREPARVLSGGQRKLLELARVLMAGPRLILLDEPAAGVNPALLETIMDRIAALNARGTGFLIIEHNMELISRLCGRVIVMASGEVLAEGAPKDVTSDARVVSAYLGGEPA